MQIIVEQPIRETIIFALIGIGVLLMSIRKKKEHTFFPMSLTNELKGFAILAIVLAHIGYFLSTDTRFLFPLSIFAGVGVDLFLFLSGYGLTISLIKKSLTPVQFYARRMTKLFIPLWFALISFLLLDWLVLGHSYPLKEIFESFVGFFPQADLFTNIDSPLWFITLIVFFYALLPFVFLKEHPIWSAVFLLMIGSFVVNANLEAIWRVVHLYRLHILAFPVGIAFAGVVQKMDSIPMRVRSLYKRLHESRLHRGAVQLLFVGIALTIFLYFATHSGVGQGFFIEQNISVITALSIVALFLLKPFDITALRLIGVYSFEIYLIHWPLLYRYDVLYQHFPASIATILSIFLFLGIAFVFQRGTQFVSKKLSI